MDANVVAAVVTVVVGGGGGGGSGHHLAAARLDVLLLSVRVVSHHPSPLLPCEGLRRGDPRRFLAHPSLAPHVLVLCCARHPHYLPANRQLDGVVLSFLPPCVFVVPVGLRSLTLAGTIPDVGEGQLECLERLKLMDNGITGERLPGFACSFLLVF